jgi:hypothetical protein
VKAVRRPALVNAEGAEIKHPNCHNFSYVIFLISHMRNVKLVKVGRMKLWAEDMQAQYANGTFARIAVSPQNSADTREYD